MSAVLPRIVARDRALGFRWSTSDGAPTSLAALCSLAGAEPDRWLPTHLEATDDLLIAVASSLGPVLGGQRSPVPDDLTAVRQAHLAIDQATAEYAAAADALDLPRDLRAGQILGTGVLLSIQCRELLNAMGPSPFAGQLDPPGQGVVGGHARLVWIDADASWQGARWVVEADDGRRLPATLAMLLFDSSGVLKDEALDEHREALRRVTDAVRTSAVEPIQASGAVDWLLFDWLMAHRDGPQSAAVEIRSGRVDDATMIVHAAAASVAVRSRFDPALSRRDAGAGG